MGMGMSNENCGPAYSSAWVIARLFREVVKGLRQTKERAISACKIDDEAERAVQAAMWIAGLHKVSKAPRYRGYSLVSDPSCLTGTKGLSRPVDQIICRSNTN